MENPKSEREQYPEKVEAVFQFEITAGQKPERADVFLANQVAGATRNRIQKAIDLGCVTINGLPIKASRRIQPGDDLVFKMLKVPPIELIPEDIPLNIIYEDDFVLVVDKPAGMCVHPGFGNRYGTLVNAVLYHFGLREKIEINIDEDDDDESSEGEIYASDDIRPGLVHRIDKDTSGLLLIAKDPASHAFLAKQFADKTTEREYWALCWGTFENSSGEVNENIIRSTRDRKVFTTAKRGGKTARTDYFVMEELEHTSLVKFVLHTGRTHQIRVHALHLHKPVFGDPVYNGRSIAYGGEMPRFRKIAERCLKIADHQLLHAKTLGFVHPKTLEFMKFSSQLPEDFKQVLELLREEANG